MAESLYSEFLKPEDFDTNVKAYYKIIEGSAEDKKYMHDSILTLKFSPMKTFSSLTGNYTYVTADVVSYDSPIPVKKRNTISKASGDIPKIGTARTLNEKEMNELDIMKLMPGMESEFYTTLFLDNKIVMVGVKETVEEMLFSALSTGTMLIEDTTNVGHGVRLDFKVPDENVFGAIWSNSDSKPIDDIKRIKEAAKKAKQPALLSYMWTDSDVISKLCENAQVRDFYGFTKGISNANVPVLSQEQLTSLFQTTLGLTIIEMDRYFIHEKDGVQTVKKGWEDNRVTFTERRKVGDLVYSKLAEHTRKKKSVMYSEPNNYILVSKKSDEDPIAEKTMAQGIVVPVLQDVNKIYFLDTAEGQVLSDSEAEGDANITIFEATYTVVQVKAGLDSINVAYEDGINDAGIITLVNTLSKAKEKALQTYLEAL